MSATLPPCFRFQPFVAGAPIPGGKVYFYAAGTTTPQNVYAVDGTTSIGNILTLDANGATDFRLGTGLSYKIDLKDAAGAAVTGWPVDQITGTDGVLISLADTASSANGDALVAVKRALTNAVATTVHRFNEDRMVNVKTDYGAKGDNSTDDSIPIQNAIDAVQAAGGGVVLFPRGTYRITVPITMTSNVILQGEGLEATVIKKTTNTVGSGSNTAPNVPANVDSYAVDSILTIKHLDATYPFSMGIKDLYLLGASGTPNTYGIYCPRATRLDIQRVFIQQCVNGFWTMDTFMSNFKFLMTWYCTTGVQWALNNTGIGSTSCNFSNCYALQCSSSGFKFYGLNYFSMDNCGSDAINVLGATLSTPEAAYSFSACTGFTMNGCGAEGNKGQSIVVNASNGVINGHQTYAPQGVASGTLGLLYIDGTSRVTFNSCQFSAITSPGALYNIVLQGGSHAIFINTPLPTGGNTYIGYGGSSTLVEYSDAGFPKINGVSQFDQSAAFTPAWTALTTVGADTSTYTYQRVGNVVYFTCRLIFATSSASTGGGTTYLTLPAAIAQPAGSSGICSVVNGNTLANIGNGAILGNKVYTPAWTASPFVIVTGSYTV